MGDCGGRIVYGMERVSVEYSLTSSVSAQYHTTVHLHSYIVAFPLRLGKKTVVCAISYNHRLQMDYAEANGTTARIGILRLIFQSPSIDTFVTDCVLEYDLLSCNCSFIDPLLVIPSYSYR